MSLIARAALVAQLGDGATALQKIRAVGNDMALDPGMGNCGKAGQWVPVGVGQPTLLIGGLTVGASSSLSGRALTKHPQVAIRPEPFGALAYHYDNRRLVFLKHPDVVRVVQALDDHPSVEATFDACSIALDRRPAFEQALTSLIDSEMLHDRTG